MCTHPNSPSLPSASTSKDHQQTIHNHCAARQKAGSSALINPMPASRTQERPRRRKANDGIATKPPSAPSPCPYACPLAKTHAPEAPRGALAAPAPALIQGYRTTPYKDPTSSPRRAPTRGAADFPCLRQLPPPPVKNMKTKGSRKVMEGRKNIPHRRKAR